MDTHRYLLVDASVLPEVLPRVLRAKELLAGGEAKSASQAAQMAGISRSAFYKYKDHVFSAETGRQVCTITATLQDETGALQALLAAVSAAGAGVVTINQSVPEDGAAQVAVAVRTDCMRINMDELCARLKQQQTVVGVRYTW